MADIRPYLEIIKNASSGDNVRDAIIDCMNEINKDSAFVVMSKVISGTVDQLNNQSPYRAPSGVVWKDVTLDIKNDDGSDMPASAIETVDFYVDNNTANETYSPMPGQQWGDIHVNIDWSAGNETIEDNVQITTKDLRVEDNTFYAEDKGLSAVRSVTFTDVNAAESRGGEVGPGGIVYYKMDFYEDEAATKIWKKGVKIAANDMIACPDPPGNPTKAGMMFSHWIPSGNPTASGPVTPKFVAASIDPREYNDETWAEIAANGGVNMPIGAYKSINVEQQRIYTRTEKAVFTYESSNPIPSDDFFDYSLTCYMIKVAAGEGGSTSSFLSTLPIVAIESSIQYNLLPSHMNSYISGIPTQGSDLYAPSKWQYDKSLEMQWVNSIFLKQIIPEEIRGAIKTVSKSFKKINEATQVVTNSSRGYPIWLPSIKELFIDGYDDDETISPATVDVEKYVTGANGVSYFGTGGSYPLADGESRYTILKKLTSYAAGESLGTSRDTGTSMYYGPQSVVALREMKSAGDIESTYIPDTTGTQYGMEPRIFGFCL